MKIDFSGREALVTGGTRGIGAEIAKALRDAGALVTVTGRTEAGFKDLTDKIGAERLKFSAVDFSDAAATEKWAGQLANQNFSIVVNNAGINKIDLLHEIDQKDWDRVQLVNVRAPMLICKAVAQSMAAKGYGRIVNISSIFGHISKSKRLSYSTSKFALLGMTKAMALDYADKNVLVNCVSPGFIDTDLTRTVLKPSEIEQLEQQVPVRRLGQASEIAKVVAFLASDLNTFITAQNIIADGGFTSV